MEQLLLFDDLAERRDWSLHWSPRQKPSKVIFVAAGQTVFHEGSTREFFYEIISGTLKSWKVTEEGRQLIFGFPTAGDCIGLTGLAVYSDTVESVTPAKLLPISWTGFQKEMLRTVKTSEKFLGWINQQDAQMQAHVSLLSIRQPASRIAMFLLEAARRQSIDLDRAQTGICLPMTQSDLATYLAMAPETYSRIMRKFRESKIIRTNVSNQSRKIVGISDAKQLNDIAKGKKI